VKIAATIAVLAIVIAGALIGWQMIQDDGASAGKPVAGGGDAAAVAVAPADAGGVVPLAHDADTAIVMLGGDAATAVAAGPVDAAPLAAGPIDAAAVAAAAADAARVAVAPDGQLVIESSPPGARVFLDGADQGVTPLTLPGSADRHSIAAVLPGHAPYIAELEGKGTFTLTLDPVTPSGGRAGIKVKCRSKDRYYVWVDGKPTGQLCPTERIDTSLGEHVVEIYDFVTETRRQYRIDVKETRLSFRIRVD
jgi:hypothetical protein